jgi:ubiquinone/menaquinone biosynthesis C-methylase UbiE
MEFTGERFVPQLSGWLALQHYHRYYFVVNHIDLKEKVVLDLACGEGFGSEILSKSSKYVYGVDVSDETIEHSKKTYCKPNLKFLVGEAASIPLDNNSIDVIVSFETLEHHNQHSEMMQEIKRVLNITGILVISSPDKGFYEKHLFGNRNKFHVKELYYEEFVKLINEYFNNCKFFIQNNIVGSLIASENEENVYKRPIHIDKESGLNEIIEPRFNICIASDSELSFSSTISICTYPTYNDFFNIIDRQIKIIKNVQSSKIWRFVRVLSKTHKKIIKLLKK